MNECTHTLDYQLIDEAQKKAKEGQLKRTYDFLSCGCINLVCQTSSTYFFQIIHAERWDWQIHNAEWRTHQEHSGCDPSVQRGTSAINSSWYLEEEDATDFKDYRKGY